MLEELLLPPRCCEPQRKQELRRRSKAWALASGKERQMVKTALTQVLKFLV
jgi:hypothetical protein